MGDGFMGNITSCQGASTHDIQSYNLEGAVINAYFARSTKRTKQPVRILGLKIFLKSLNVTVAAKFHHRECAIKQITKVSIVLLMKY